MDDVVVVTGARKRYGPTAALDGVDLQVARGQLHGLLGRNGAGKTTLLRSLLGLVRLDEGTVDVLGAPAAPARAGVAGSCDTPRSWPSLTGRRTLQLLDRLDGGGAPARVDAVLDRTGLSGVADQRVAGWSTGQRQRLALAASLLRDPRLLVLDEPTSGLDPVGVQDVHALLRELVADGVTVLLSSHDLVEVAALCSHVTVVAGGQVRYAGTLPGLLARVPPARQRLRTSDDAAAQVLLGGRATGGAGGLLVSGDVDAVVLDLARHGIAVRGLAPVGDPLAEAFLGLTA